MSLEIHVNASSACTPSPKPVLTGSSKEKSKGDFVLACTVQPLLSTMICVSVVALVLLLLT